MQDACVFLFFVFFLRSSDQQNEREDGGFAELSSGWSAEGDRDETRQTKSSGGVREEEEEDENRALKTRLTRTNQKRQHFHRGNAS